MHQLYSVMSEVEETHPGLGNALGFSIICTKARKCLLLIAPSGCGKSVITDIIGIKHPEAVRLFSVTRAGLKRFKEQFSNFWGVIVMDDMAGAGSIYERKETLTAFAFGCYAHSISKHTFTTDFEIVNFHAAVIMNTQPSILAEIYQYPEWESILQDKVVRYYHLYRPTQPNEAKPDFKIDWGIDVDSVHKPDHRYKLYPKLIDIAVVQWSDARVLEHLNMLLKASAALDRREEVNQDDFLLLHRLMRPLTVEKHVMEKTGFETGRWMNVNLLDVLVEFASWGNPNVRRMARDYKLSESRVYQLLQSIEDWFVPDPVRSKSIVPKPELGRVLKEAGVKR